MKLTWRLWWLPRALAAGGRAPVHGQSFGFPWWRDAQFQRELTLTTDQTTAHRRASSRRRSRKLRAKKAELDQQEEELSRLIAANADELDGHEAGRQGRSHRSRPEQNAHAVAPPYPAGAHPRTAGQAEQAVRAVGRADHARAVARQTGNNRRERPAMRRNRVDLGVLGSPAGASASRGRPRAQQVTDARIRELIAEASPADRPGRRRAGRRSRRRGAIASGGGADTRRRGEVRARSKSRYRGAATESADQRHRRRQHPVGLQSVADIDRRAAVDTRTPDATRSSSARTGGVHR